MAGPRPNTVWVIGAGFSEPLDGPLLSDLFRRERLLELQEQFDPEVYPGLAEDMRQVQSLFWLGLQDGRWPNAEKFLAFVDDAFAGPGETKMGLLAAMLHRSVQATEQLDREQPADPNAGSLLLNRLDRRVRRALAAECTRFLPEEPDTTTEAWLPYVQWLNHLDPKTDAIIGLNYDHVVETADPGDKVEVVLPVDDLPQGKVPYLKLHGSASWYLFEEGEEKVKRIGLARSPREALRNKGDIAIAAPGASKAKFCDAHLVTLWGLAEKLLREAKRICLIGYGFPKTDPRAQDRLLEAIGQARHSVTVDLVLGDNIASPASQRVLALLRSARNRRVLRVNGEGASTTSSVLSIRQHQLWTQDFLLRPERYLEP